MTPYELATLDRREKAPRLPPLIVDGYVVCRDCSLPMSADGMVCSTLVGYGERCPLGAHDDNCLSQGYHCANGHAVMVSIRRSCPCGWLGKERCFCHAGDKVREWPR